MTMDAELRGRCTLREQILVHRPSFFSFALHGECLRKAHGAQEVLMVTPCGFLCRGTFAHLPGAPGRLGCDPLE
jgi:hypothetical protein